MSTKNIEAKRRAIENRIRGLERQRQMAEEYLETGAHADRLPQPLFVQKLDENGKPLPPHKDWVKNVILKKWIPRRLAECNKALKRLEH